MNVEYFLLIIFTHFTIILKEIYSEETVLCDVKSNPAVFGKDVSISCKYNGSSTCIENRTRTWTKGHNKDFLFMDGYPTAIAERYEENVISCSEVELKITNFSSDDLNNYHCSIDFQECELPLNLNPNKFEYHPNVDEIKKDITVSNEYFFFFVDVSPVYPRPTCTVFYGNKQMNDILKENISKIGHFYQTKLNLEFKASVKICPITANATCNIGQTEISLLKFELKNCSDIEEQVSLTLNSTEKTIFCILTGICLALVLWSMCRNRTLILKTYKELSNRKVWDSRRPLLAVLATFGSMSCDILTFTKIVEDNQTPIICFGLALLLTFASLVLVSNTNTISIREGFKKACQRFIEKFEKCIFSNGPRQQNTVAYSTANIADDIVREQSA
ncbi:unnamed protein product [Mytilus coruscus]|uniref:Ig-like domain-containing protein n=1 Tax=Mytilus coruscus TaxID=42192 RepID=A0A6J8EK20_MYTCO|nr:unnamed protein product [Mytilus coruscus]